MLTVIRLWKKYFSGLTLFYYLITYLKLFNDLELIKV
jgi:hypothetical protein